MKKLLWVVLLFPAMFVAGCGKSETPVSAPLAEEAKAPSAPVMSVFDPADAATLTGKVVYTGAPPAPRALSLSGNPECAMLHATPLLSEELLVKDGALQNAFIYIKEGLEGRSFAAPAEPVIVENKGCAYVPHVVGVQTGQPFVLINADNTLHNVHAYPKANKPFNLGLPIQGMKQTRKFDAPEIMVPIKCDVHPWMLGFAGVLSHPYFAVTGEDGSFSLKGLPPGTYTVEVWHEKLGTQSQKIEIGPREAKEIGFTYA